MKPGVSSARTGVLPSRSASAVIESSVSALVSAPPITSTSAITGAGLKKCIPATRSGGSRPLAIAVIDSDEVFDARIASGPQTRAKSEKNLALQPQVFRDAPRSPPARRATPPAPSPRECARAPHPAPRPSSAREQPRARIRPARARSRAPLPPLKHRRAPPAHPAPAANCAIPAPIVPAPTTPRRVISLVKLCSLCAEQGNEVDHAHLQADGSCRRAASCSPVLLFPCSTLSSGKRRLALL